jgi:hypothetical protein
MTLQTQTFSSGVTIAREAATMPAKTEKEPEKYAKKSKK